MKARIIFIGFVLTLSSIPSAFGDSAIYYENQTGINRGTLWDAYMDEIQVLGGVPRPMGRNTYGYWGVTFVNPTNNTVTVTQVSITVPSNTFGTNPIGVRPAAGWTRVSNSNITWSGSVSVPANSAYDFIVRIRGSSQNRNDQPVTLTAVSSAGTFQDTAHRTEERNGNLAYANLYLWDGGAPRFYIENIASSTSRTFTVRMAETGNRNIRTGAMLRVEVPAGWYGVTAPTGQAGLTDAVIEGNISSGWIITTYTTSNLQNANRDFQFNAAPPNVETNSTYQLNAYLVGRENGNNRFVATVAESVVQVVPGTQPLINVDSVYLNVSSKGGVTELQTFGGVPRPMDRNTYGYWGVTFVNPTDSPVTVTQVSITVPSNTFGTAPTGVRPAAGWTRVSNSNITWSGSVSVPAHSAYDFIVQIRGSNQNRNDQPVTLTAVSSAGTFQDTAHRTEERNNNLVYANLYLWEGGAPRFYIENVASDTSRTFTVRMAETSDTGNIRTGTMLRVEIPAGWYGVTASTGQTGLTDAVIEGNISSGWIITTYTTSNLRNANRDFQFSTTPPNVGTNSTYLLNAYLVGRETGNNRFVATVAESIVQVTPVSDGINVTHQSQNISAPVDLTKITNITINSTFRSSASVNYSFDVYNFTSTQWVNINEGIVDSTVTTWTKTFNFTDADLGDFVNQTDPSSRYILVRFNTSNSTYHILNEDQLFFNISYDITAPNVTIITPNYDDILSGAVYINATVVDDFIGIDTVYANVSNSVTFYTYPMSAYDAENWTATWDTTAVQDGYYNITIYANDSVGNLNSTVYIPVTVNNVNPEITFASPTPANASVTDTTYVYVNITLNEEGSVAYLEWTNSTGSYNLTMNKVGTLNFWYNVTLTGDYARDYSYKVYANDTVDTWNVSETRALTVRGRLTTESNYSMAPASVTASVYNISMMNMTLNATGEAINITSITVTKTGNYPNAYINVSLYWDVDQDTTPNPGNNSIDADDVLLAGPATFSGSGTYTFSLSPPFQVNTTATRTIIVYYDIFPLT